MSQKLTEFVLRPGQGKIGRPVRVRANYFEVTELPVDNIIHYDVTITPDVPPALNRKIFEKFEEDNFIVGLGGCRTVYDGRKNIFAPRILPFGETATFDVTLPNDDEITGITRNVRSFKIKIKKAGEIVMTELHNFLRANGPMTSGVLTAIMAIDVLIRHLPSMQYVTVGRSFFTSNGSMALFGGAEVWQGYYQSARPTPGKMMINIDLSATAFYEGGPLIQMVIKLLGKRNHDDLRRGLNEKECIKIEKAIKNLKIRVIHRGVQNTRRRFKIAKLTSTPANMTKFETEHGPMDVASYFQRTYNSPLQFPKLPCVAVKRDVYLPIEVCEVIEGQRHIRKLNEKQTADMIKFTCQAPTLRANKIKQGVEILNYRENKYLAPFFLKISNEMANIPARILPAPTIQYHRTSREQKCVPRDGVWNLRDKKLATCATLGAWSLVAFGAEREFPIQSIQAFIRELVISCQEVGLHIPNRSPPIMHANPQGDVDSVLKQAWLRAGNAVQAQPQLIVCILPTTGESLYAEIKRVCDTEIGVASQCVQLRHMMQAKKQYCVNLCLKMNVKLGGMNCYLAQDTVPFVSERPTIIMGADVTHSSPGDASRPSIASLCATMDAKISRYAASIRVQTGRSDIIADLANMVKELLRNFYQACGRKPERILFYRDGVSEGQFTHVLENEIKAVRAACRSLDASYRPTITFVVVQKRHHTRFFPVDRNSSDRTGNCLPGTVIEQTIIHPFEFDFYLQSHAGLQGASRPTHYHVLHDENRFKPDDLQILTYHLCYVYARCTRAVSLVPPVLYSHLLCRRARYHARLDSWTEGSSTEANGVPSSFGNVKPDLAKVMYFM
ncbi:5713_t:CDS:10 [Ambispora gerdemannii]|uniref:5713_t:CDS:1 n=1 Tax=Ambispora gerdemannii TaxID=144530 RepID=A0A9N9A8I0_9GLOM|nr:5713_t:CDS:10 [Ambispora gerdemannii]